MSKLFLDDCRQPPPGWDLVRNYQEFVAYIQEHGVPDIISFDHDLADVHYAFNEQVSEFTPADKLRCIPYGSYSEKTGYHCALWLEDKGIKVKKWMVHSANPVGADNIRFVMRRICPEGECNMKLQVISGEKWWQLGDGD